MSINIARLARTTPVSQPLYAGALAALLSVIITRGIEVRARGNCLGTRVASRLQIHVGGRVELTSPSSTSERSAALFHARAHAKTGHDPGCHAFGVALAELAAIARMFDAQGAAGYLCDAIEQAAAHIGEHLEVGGEWSIDFAHEVIDVELARRVTPREFEEVVQRTTAASGSRQAFSGSRRWQRAA